MDVTSRALGSNYRLVSRIGTGAMGEVWRAEDIGAGTDVAAKVLRSEFSHNPEIVSRFVQERSILMGLDHPAIVRVRDLVVERDRLAIIMDLVDGSDLRAALREAGTLPPALAARVVARVLEGLAAAHSQGALHRDVKPDNVLLTHDWTQLRPDAIRISDFGIARLAQDSTVQATGLLGTPEYMPPELFEHGTSSAASDVYAAGVVLYELLAGRTPYAGSGTAYTIGNRAVTMEPPRLDLPESLQQLLASLLAKDPRRRLKAGTAAETLVALADDLAGVDALPVQPIPTSWVRTRSSDLAHGTIRPASAPASFDVGGTNLDVTFAPETQAAQAGGEVRALVPGAGPDLEAGVTNVGAVPATYHPPVLEPAVQKHADRPERSRVRRWLLPGTIVVVVLCVVGGFLLLRGHGSADDKHAAMTTAVSAHQQDDKVRGTGLQVSREASYDPEHHEVELTVNLTADRVPLKGPFLQVLPMPAGSTECPLPVWSGADSQPNNPQITGITAPCGSVLTVPTVPANGTRTVTAKIAMDLTGSDPQQQLASWLDRTGSLTSSALSDTGKNDTWFASQRLQDIEVVAPAAVSVHARQLRVVLYPVWPTGVDRIHPMFNSAIGRSSQLLDQAAGGLRNLSLFDRCHTAVSVNRDRSISVLHQTDRCTIVVNVGNLTGLTSTPFQITDAGS
ncbi:serine/threonine-protein kinase [Nocardioides terrisoli]|uniref:serine/threonine-protein kinase n=1 Tax=Nocardioides terrisoli TaxID=3388267 RepID=UPI00287B6233|nr:serine/threonine-protein kinase [Nocardioides marmorisolisilvae]